MERGPHECEPLCLLQMSLQPDAKLQKHLSGHAVNAPTALSMHELSEPRERTRAALLVNSLCLKTADNPALAVQIDCPLHGLGKPEPRFAASFGDKQVMGQREEARVLREDSQNLVS